MTLPTQHPTPDHSSAVLTAEQRQASGRCPRELPVRRIPAGTMPASTANSVHWCEREEQSAAAGVSRK